ncbi:hypothetical protein [Mycoplasmopsis gallopavonis]|uniref:Uncharacterized protein n=1 Tax=Mycoplasmopsis gallopavonis TaxID=76629 RepID=A0A449AZ59_9BACT|nr:hypothetical protein [Mycoplasmopsis gallopavonis]RIV16919.1 hypothetical protein D1113_00355 [Mycoplasmopsis gallopavonis]VEU72746.1 Uncharacterised protein [Mycoplasmopsis gallopavonis]
MLALRESFRKIQKEKLAKLMKAANDKINALSIWNLHYYDFERHLANLNKQSQTMVDEFSPTVSDVLTEQIKKYLDLLTALDGINSLADILGKARKANDFINHVYNNLNEDPFTPSPYEKASTDLASDILNKLEGYNNKAASGQELTPEDYEDINKLRDQILNIQDNSPKLDALDSDIKEADATVDDITSSDSYQQASIANPALKNKIDKALDELAKLKEEAAKLFADPNAKTSDITAMRNAIKAKNDELKGFVGDLSTGANLKSLEDKIRETYPHDVDETITPGEKALWDRLNKVKELSLQPNLTLEDQKLLSKEIEDLGKAIPLVKKLEDRANELKAKSEDYNQEPKSKYVNNDSEEALDQLDNAITNALNNINSYGQDAIQSPTITSTSLLGLLNDLNDKNDDFDLSYQKERLQQLNQEAQEQAYPASEIEDQSDVKNLLNQSLKALDKYAQNKLDENDVETISKAGDLFDKELPLIAKIKETIALSDSYKDSKPEVKKYLDQVLANNMPSPSDSEEDIARKLANIEKAQSTAAQMNDFIDVYKELDNILSDDKANPAYKDKAYLNDVLLDIEKQKEDYAKFTKGDNNYQNEVSPENLQEAKEKLALKIEALKKARDNKIEDFNDAVVQADEKIAALDQEKQTRLEDYPNEKFEKYDAAKAALQELEQSNEATKESIDAAREKLDLEFEKDKALNLVDALHRINNDDAYANLPEYQTTKAATDAFEGYVNNIINTQNPTIDQVKDLEEKVKENTKLVGLQQLVAGYLDSKKDDPNFESQREALENALRNSLPTADNQYSDLKDRYEKLLEAFTAEKELEKQKQLNQRALEHKVGDQVEAGLRKDFFDELSPTTNDPEAINKVNETIDSLLEANKNAATLAEAEKIRDKIATLEGNKIAIRQLSEKVKLGLDAIEKTNGSTSNAVQSIKEELEEKIKKAREEYGDSENNVKDLNALAPEVALLTEKLEKSLLIEAKIKQIQADYLDTNINYYTLNGRDGQQARLTLLKNYLKNLGDFSTNTGEKDSSKWDNILTRLNVFEELAKELQVVSEKIKDWKNEANSYIGYNTDAEALIQAMWDNTPNPINATKNLDDNSPLTTFKTNLETKLSAQQEINAKRVDVHENKVNPTILEIQTLTTPEDSAKFNDLYAELNKRISNYSEKTDTAQTLTNLETLSTKIDYLNSIFAKLKELATTIYDVKNFLAQVSPIGDLIQAVDELNENLNSSDLLYQNESVTNEELNNKIEELKFKFRVIQIKSKVVDFKQTLDSNTILKKDEKKPFEDVYNQILATINSVTQSDPNKEETFASILDNYFNDEPSSINNLYKYLENANNLRTKINEAEKYLVKEKQQAESDKYVDSAAAIEKYQELRNQINEANEANKLAIENSIFATKNAQKSSLDMAITDLVRVKVNSANVLYQKLNAFKDAFTRNNLTTTLGTNFDTVLNELNSYSPSAEQKSKPEVIDETNKLLSKGFDVFREAMTNATNTLQTNLYDINSEIKNYNDDFANNSKTLLNETEVTAYQGLVANLRENQTFAQDKENVIVDSYLNFDLTDHLFQNEYVLEFVNKINHSKELITEFKTNLKQDVATLINEISIFDTFFKSKYTENSDSFIDKYEALKSQFNSKLKSDLEEVNTLQTNLTDTSGSSTLATYSSAAKQLKQDYVAYLAKLKEEIQKTINSRENLTEIFNELFTNDIGWNNTNLEVYNTIVAPYNQEFTNINQKLNAISNEVSDVNLTALKELDSSMETFIAWPKTHKNDFALQLTQQVNGKDRYQNITANETTTIEKLSAFLNSLDSNTQEIDITTYTRFLDFFDQFAFTAKDSLEPSSIYNLVNFRVFLVKNDSSEWYSSVASQDDSVKIGAFKLKYVYEPQSLNVYADSFDRLEVVKDNVQISFKTTGIIKIPNGNTSIFYDASDSTKIGKVNKLKVLNVREAGWNVTTREQAITKAIDVFKKMVVEKQNDPDFAQNNKFKFQLQDLSILDSYVQVKSYLDEQRMRFYVNEDTKEIVIAHLTPSSMTSFPPGSGNLSVSWDNTKTFWKVRQGVYNAELTMPAALLSAIRFSFEFDPDTGDLFIYNTWLESMAVIKNRLTLTNQQSTITRSQFADELMASLDTDKTWIKITPYRSGEADRLKRGKSSLLIKGDSEGVNSSKTRQWVTEITSTKYGWFDAFSRSGFNYVGYNIGTNPYSANGNPIVYGGNDLAHKLPLSSAGILEFEYKIR